MTETDSLAYLDISHIITKLKTIFNYYKTTNNLVQEALQKLNFHARLANRVQIAFQVHGEELEDQIEFAMLQDYLFQGDDVRMIKFF